MGSTSLKKVSQALNVVKDGRLRKAGSVKYELIQAAVTNTTAGWVINNRSLSTLKAGSPRSRQALSDLVFCEILLSDSQMDSFFALFLHGERGEESP